LADGKCTEISETSIRRVVTVGDRVRFLIFQYGICCRQIGTKTGFYISNTSRHHWQSHSIHHISFIYHWC